VLQYSQIALIEVVGLHLVILTTIKQELTQIPIAHLEQKATLQDATALQQIKIALQQDHTAPLVHQEIVDTTVVVVVAVDHLEVVEDKKTINIKKTPNRFY